MRSIARAHEPATNRPCPACSPRVIALIHAFRSFPSAVGSTPPHSQDLNYDATKGCGGTGTGTAVSVAFQYHMYGATIGQLEVRSGSKTLWSIAGPQGNQWHTVHIALGEVSSFSFIASRGTSYTGDIAVDAIEIKCAIAVRTATPATPATSPQAFKRGERSR